MKTPESVAWRKPGGVVLCDSIGIDTQGRPHAALGEPKAKNFELSDDICAAYVLTFAVQIMLVSGLLTTMRLGNWLVCRRRDRKKPERHVQFSVASVLGWVTAIALALAAWKSALIHSGWPMEVLKGAFFLFVGVFYDPLEQWSVGDWIVAEPSESDSKDFATRFERIKRAATEKSRTQLRRQVHAFVAWLEKNG